MTNPCAEMAEPVPILERRNGCPVEGFKERIGALPLLKFVRRRGIFGVSEAEKELLPKALPVAFSARRYNFVELSTTRCRQAAKKRLCGVCGTKLGERIIFLVSTAGRFSTSSRRDWEERRFDDPPMHPDCAEFVLNVCPHYKSQLYCTAWIEARTYVSETFQGWDDKSRVGFYPREIVGLQIFTEFKSGKGT